MEIGGATVPTHPHRWPFGDLAAGLALVAFGIVCQAIKMHHGMPGRLPKAWLPFQASNGCGNGSAPRPLRSTALKGKLSCFGAPWQSARRRAVVWGDSHAEQLALSAEAATNAETAVLIYRNCPANVYGAQTLRDVADGPDHSTSCGKESPAGMLQFIGTQHIDTVILAAAWTLMLPQLHSPSRAAGAELLERGLRSVIGEMGSVRNVALISDIPLRDSSPADCESRQFAFFCADAAARPTYRDCPTKTGTRTS